MTTQCITFSDEEKEQLNKLFPEVLWSKFHAHWTGSYWAAQLAGKDGDDNLLLIAKKLHYEKEEGYGIAYQISSALLELRAIGWYDSIGEAVLDFRRAWIEQTHLITSHSELVLPVLPSNLLAEEEKHRNSSD